MIAFNPDFREDDAHSEVRSFPGSIETQTQGAIGTISKKTIILMTAVFAGTAAISAHTFGILLHRERNMQKFHQENVRNDQLSRETIRQLNEAGIADPTTMNDTLIDVRRGK